MLNSDALCFLLLFLYFHLTNVLKCIMNARTRCCFLTFLGPFLWLAIAKYRHQWYLWILILGNVQPFILDFGIDNCSWAAGLLWDDLHGVFLSVSCTMGTHFSSMSFFNVAFTSTPVKSSFWQLVPNARLLSSKYHWSAVFTSYARATVLICALSSSIGVFHVDQAASPASLSLSCRWTVRLSSTVKL